MLYLDQPVQVGMSYDTLTNVTNNIDTGVVETADFSKGVPAQNSKNHVLHLLSGDKPSLILTILRYILRRDL